MKLGKLPARVDARTFKFESPAGYVPPPARAWSSSVTNLGEMLNSGLNCCTAAAAGHLIQSWTAAAGAQRVPSDHDIFEAYQAVTGYDPARPETDKGAYALDFLERWRKVGLGGHRIDRYAVLAPRDRTQTMAAIDLCGGAYVGLQLPMSAEQQPDWRVRLGDTTGEWRGHMIAVLDYDADGLVCVTWGKLRRMTWRYWDAYADESYAILSPDQPPDPRRDALAPLLRAA